MPSGKPELYRTPVVDSKMEISSGVTSGCLMSASCHPHATHLPRTGAIGTARSRRSDRGGWSEAIAEKRLGRVGRPAGGQRRAMAVSLRIGEEVELVFVRRTPRHAHGLGFVPLFCEPRTTGIGRVERGALRQVIELVGGLPLVAPLAKRAEEPEDVPSDWAAQRKACV